MKRETIKILFFITPLWISYMLFTGEFLFQYLLSLLALDKFFITKQLSHKNELFFVILVVIFTPIMEELIFRYPLKFFKNKVTAALCFSLIFSILHSGNYHFQTNNYFIILFILIPIFNASLVLSYLRLKYGFYFSVWTHSFYNLIVLPLI